MLTPLMSASNGLSFFLKSLLGLSVLLLLTGPAPTSLANPSSSAAPPWQLLSDWQCLLPMSTCATFYPSSGSAPLTQHWRQNQALPADGRLTLGTGRLTLLAPDGGFLTLTGPGTFYLVQGRLIPLAMVDGRYEHSAHPSARPSDGNRVANSSTAPSQPRTQLLIPPLVAGPDGTRVEFVMTRQGGVALQVLDGRACVRWIDVVTAAPECLSHGEGLVIDSTHPESRQWYRLSPDDARTHLAQLRRAARVSESRAPSGSVEALHEEFLTVLPTLAASQVLVQAQALVTAHADAALTPRALYFAWIRLQSDGLAIPAALADRAALATLLQTHYPDSLWTKTLEAEGAAGAAGAAGASAAPGAPTSGRGGE